MANAVSLDGRIVVGNAIAPSGYYEAFRWSAEEGMIGLGAFAQPAFQGEHSNALAVSADGSTIVGYSRSGPEGHQIEAFVWTEQEGMLPLGDLPGGDFFSKAFGVSGDGSIVVGGSWIEFDGNQQTARPFVWDRIHGMRQFDTLLEDEYGLGRADRPNEDQMK